MVQNTYKVPVKQWRKWDAEQRGLFNSIYEEIKNLGPDLFLHPVTLQRKHPLSTRKGLTNSEFNTIAWNAAWTAADALRKQFCSEVVTLYRGQPVATDVIKRRAA